LGSSRILRYTATNVEVHTNVIAIPTVEGYFNSITNLEAIEGGREQRVQPRDNGSNSPSIWIDHFVMRLPVGYLPRPFGVVLRKSAFGRLEEQCPLQVNRALDSRFPVLANTKASDELARRYMQEDHLEELRAAENIGGAGHGD